MKKFFPLIFLLTIFSTFRVADAQRGKSPPRIVKRKPLLVTVQAANDPPKNLTPEVKRRYDAFLKVWKTIDEYYFDKTFNGLNWFSVKTEFEPRVLNAKTDRELHLILQEMINRLHHSHLAIITPEVFKAIENVKTEVKTREKQLKDKIAASDTPDEEDEKEALDLELNENARYGLGIDLRLIDDNFVITRIEKKSSGELVGLKTGYVISKINGVSLNDLLAKIRLYNHDSKDVINFLPIEILNDILNGMRGEVNLEILDAANQPQQFKVKRERLKGEAVSIGKNYPEQYLRFQTESLDDETGYVKFNIFALPVVADFCAALTELKTKKAIIIDLRGNFGGIIGTMGALAGMLTTDKIDLGTQFFQVGSENLTITSKAKNFKGRIVVLVDALTVSSAEIFAAALQENNRALIVGDRTAGEALPTVSTDLPTGAVLTYPIANYKTHLGKLVEGSGVEPNYKIALDRGSLLENKDSQLETALRLIRENKDFPKAVETQKPAELSGIGGSDAPPPPPPPPPVAVKSLPLIPPPMPPKAGSQIETKDLKAQQLIDNFIVKIGGVENLQKINSYHFKGETQITVRGTQTDAAIDVYMQQPDKFAEILRTESLGEVREIYTSRQSFVQTDYGIDQPLPAVANINNLQVLYPIFNLLDKDYFKELKYLGIFPKDSVNYHVIQGKNKYGTTIALTFDVTTGELESYTGNYSTINFGSYRQTGAVKLPFEIEQGNFFKIDITDYELNKPIEPAIFNKKENCFDRPD